MKAVLLDAPGPPDALQIQDLPILTPGVDAVLNGTTCRTGTHLELTVLHYESGLLSQSRRGSMTARDESSVPFSTRAQPVWRPARPR